MQPPLVDWRDTASAQCPCQLSSLHSDGCGRSLELDRDRLQFNLSFGSGWFGWIVQGVYKREGVDGAAEEVIVQVLKEEASMDEEIGFREISLLAVMGGGHPNVLHLVGHSYDAIPRLQAYELCALGDLKSFLADNRGQRRLSPANQIPRTASLPNSQIGSECSTSAAPSSTFVRESPPASPICTGETTPCRTWPRAASRSRPPCR